MDRGLLQVLLQRFDLQGYLIDRGGKRTTPDEWELLCPRCGKQKLVVNVEKRAWHCWHCLRQTPPDKFGKRLTIDGAGSLVALLVLLEHWTLDQVLSHLVAGSWWSAADLQKIACSDLMADAIGNPQVPVVIPYPKGVQNFVDGNVPYLIQRGIGFDDVRDFGLFWCDRGRYRGRLMFPVFENGILVYYQGRAMWEEPGNREFRKSLNPPREPGAATSDQVLFNLDRARYFDRVALTEGPIDAIHVGASAVCTFGKRITPLQVAKLMQAGVRAVDLLWDADAAAEMQATLPFLSQFFDARIVTVPPGYDPGALPRQYLAQLRAAAAVPVGESQSRLATV